MLFHFPLRKYHCTGHRFGFPQRGERRREGPCAGPPQAPIQPPPHTELGFVLQCLSAGAWQSILDVPGDPGNLFPGGKERYPFHSLIPFQDWELLSAKHVCWTDLKKAFPDPTCCFRLLHKQAGSLCCTLTINNTTHKEQRAGVGGVCPHTLPIVFFNLGTVSNLSSAEAFLCLFGWTGRASLSASWVSSRRLSTQCSLARQPEVTAAAYKWAQALPSALGTHGPPRTGCLLPCWKVVTPGWTLPSAVSTDSFLTGCTRKSKREARVHMLWNSDGWEQITAILPSLYQICATQENDHVSRANVLHTHQPLHPWNSPTGWDF